LFFCTAPDFREERFIAPEPSTVADTAELYA
jgi:hypothetical protein